MIFMVSVYVDYKFSDSVCVLFTSSLDPLDSTFNLTNGSVFDLRMLKRQSQKTSHTIGEISRERFFVMIEYFLHDFLWVFYTEIQFTTTWKALILFSIIVSMETFF